MVFQSLRNISDKKRKRKLSGSKKQCFKKKLPGITPSNSRQLFVCQGCEKIGNVNAEICKDVNGEEHVKQNKNEHFCELRQFDPSKYQSDIVVTKSMFEVIESNAKYFVSGKTMKYLFIFTSTEQKMCYRFNYSGKFFYCSKCNIQKLDIRAHICKNENGEEYISIQDKQHICEPSEYHPEKFELKIIKAPDYQIMEQRFRGKWVQKLYIFSSKEKDLCYEYTWHEKKQYYLCNPCMNKFNSFVHARVLKDDDNEEYVKLGWKEHVCKPVKFEPEDSNIIKKPDYEIKKCINRCAEVTYLFITHPIDKKCYQYTFKKKENKFICNPCKPSRIVVARLRKDENDEEFIELGKTEHVCQSKEELSGSNIINLPNFKLVNNGKDLFIFDKNDKEKCYSYVYRPSTKNFLCRKCIAQKLRVSATLLQYPNGEEYLRIGKNGHICKPEKYQPFPINREYRSQQ